VNSCVSIDSVLRHQLGLNSAKPPVHIYTSIKGDISIGSAQTVRLWQNLLVGDNDEVVLAGGNLTRVVRIGDTVRRGAGPWTPLVHELLAHVRARGFEYAPKPMGLDDVGREVLSYISGDTIVGHPWPEWVWSDSLLIESVHALRDFHTAVSDFRPAEVESRLGCVPLEFDQIVCHNDFAPYNCVFRNGRLAGVIDWDVIWAGRPVWDLAFFIWHWVPLHAPSQVLQWRTTDECARRLRLILQEYGPVDCEDVVEEVIRRIASSRDGILSRAEAGDVTFAKLKAEGHADEMQRAIDFIESIRPSLTISIRTQDISAVVALVRDESGRVLLVSSSDAGPWSCIGGGLAVGEDPASAAVKFAQDDCGLAIEVGQEVAHLSGEGYRVLYECGEDTSYDATVFDATALGIASDIPMRSKWFDAEQLASAYLDEFASVALVDLGLRRSS